MGESRRRDMMGLGPKQVKMEVKIDTLKDRVCDCGCKAFMKVFGLKELPSFCSPNGKDETMMLHVGFACIACGKMMPLVAGQELPKTGKDNAGGEAEAGQAESEEKEEPKSNLIKL